LRELRSDRTKYVAFGNVLWRPDTGLTDQSEEPAKSDRLGSWPNNGSAEAAESHRPPRLRLKYRRGNASIPFRLADSF